MEARETTVSSQGGMERRIPYGASYLAGGTLGCRRWFTVGDVTTLVLSGLKVAGTSDLLGVQVRWSILKNADQCPAAWATSYFTTRTFCILAKE